MSSNYVMIDGKRINLSNETVSNLKRELGIKVIEFGDIVTCIIMGVIKSRVALYNENGELVAVNQSGKIAGDFGDLAFYTHNGFNIFKSNLLNLDA